MVEVEFIRSAAYHAPAAIALPDREFIDVGMIRRRAGLALGGALKHA